MTKLERSLRRKELKEYFKNCKPVKGVNREDIIDTLCGIYKLDDNYFNKVKTDKRKNNKRPPYKDRSLIKQAIYFLIPIIDIELVGGKKECQRISKELFCQHINQLKQNSNG